MITLLTMMPKIEEDLIYIPPYIQTIMITLAITSIVLFIATILTVVLEDKIGEKQELILKIEVATLIVCLLSIFFIYIYHEDSAKHAFQDKQYSLIREKSTLTIQSESKYLETKNFQIIGEDESHLFLKHGNKLYELQYKENIQQKDETK